MFKLIAIFSFISVLAGCMGDEPGTHYTFEVTNPASSDQAERIDYDYKVYGYHKLGRALVDTPESLVDLLADLETKADSVPYHELAGVLNATSIDFDQYNLLIYTSKESSTSIELTPLVPEIDSTGEYISIYINRYEPYVGDTAIGTHTFIYKISKSIKEVHFHNGPSREEYQNVAGGMDTPLNCQSLTWCKDKPIAPVIEHIAVPFREHGYSHFNTTVISDENSLNGFTKQLYSQDGWNNVEGFVEPLLKANIRFDEYNLILFRLTEGSGSIVLNPWTPTVNGDIAEVKIDRTVPSIGTDDMAYYVLAYAVKKDVKELHFVGAKHDEIIANKAGFNIAPLNCQSWNDGCNDCSRGDDGLVACTERACSDYDTLHCKVWD